MKRNNRLVLVIVILSAIAVLWVIYSFSVNKADNSASVPFGEVQQNTNYQGPPPGSVPGTGFQGPTGSHP